MFANLAGSGADAGHGARREHRAVTHVVEVVERLPPELVDGNASAHGLAE
jgi:hypothetical protein